MKRPKKQREHRIGSGFKPEVLDSALLHLEQRVLLPKSTEVAEAHPITETSVAKERLKEAQDAYKNDPSDANRQAFNDAHHDLRTSIETEFMAMDPSKAFQVSKKKALSLRAKADDMMKLIRDTKFERNEAQMRADGMAIMRVDKKRTQLEAKYAMLVDEMRFYQTLMGAVYKNDDFSESDDFAQVCQKPNGDIYGTAGQCRKGRPISLKPGEGVMAAIGKARERGLKHREIGEVLNAVREKHGAKQIRHGRGLTEAQQLLGEVIQKKKGPQDPVKSLPTDMRAELFALGKGPQSPTPLAKPDSLYGAWSTDRLQKQKKFLEGIGAGPPRLDAELARRGVVGKIGSAQTVVPPQPKVAAQKPSGAGAFPSVKATVKDAARLKADYDSPTSKDLGSGAMGTVKQVKGPPPGIVKSGSIGQFEAAALKKLEGTGVAPTLHGQVLQGKPKEVDYGLGAHVSEAKGLIGMSKAKGKPVQDLRGVSGKWPIDTQKAAQVVDEYIRVRSVIHKNGIAHNDMHEGNFFFDSITGRGSAVDFGLAQVSPKAALAEAMGTTSKAGSYNDAGDWQAARVLGNYSGGRQASSNYDRLVANRKAVEEEMKRNHPQDYKDVYRDGGIRNDHATILDGVKMSDQQAQAYINRLYEGIE